MAGRVDAFECPARRQQAHDLRRRRLTGSLSRAYRLYGGAGEPRPAVLLWDEPHVALRVSLAELIQEMRA